MRLAKQKLGAQQGGYSRIGCDTDIYNEIAEIADKCGYTLTSVTNALLGFALENSEIITETKTVEVNTFRIGNEEFDGNN
ncbi:hypothetical protein [Streptococcus gallolyticus]|jgi:hypothetical protein|uniref:hypothetical protein n=1 Tax=Streptococcus gallolyticus TaxID=315405 RepID=UPI0022842C36|nr:hypothetical protein [Streptococcus gallolyticus]MCY7192541.1 hypothetical protein [Streptococcus gallolyticus subsp. gallolyticus]WAW99444.1 hypothetical protein OIY87_03605 [Streptococcus gallolyticus]